MRRDVLRRMSRTGIRAHVGMRALQQSLSDRGRSSRPLRMFMWLTARPVLPVVFVLIHASSADGHWAQSVAVPTMRQRVQVSTAASESLRASRLCGGVGRRGDAADVCAGLATQATTRHDLETCMCLYCGKHFNAWQSWRQHCVRVYCCDRTSARVRVCTARMRVYCTRVRVCTAYVRACVRAGVIAREPTPLSLRALQESTGHPTRAACCRLCDLVCRDRGALRVHKVGCSQWPGRLACVCGGAGSASRHPSPSCVSLCLPRSCDSHAVRQPRAVSGQLGRRRVGSGVYQRVLID
jgi:hypothetical protein